MPSSLVLCSLGCLAKTYSRFREFGLGPSESTPVFYTTLFQKGSEDKASRSNKSNILHAMLRVARCSFIFPLRGPPPGSPLGFHHLGQPSLELRAPLRGLDILPYSVSLFSEMDNPCEAAVFPFHLFLQWWELLALLVCLSARGSVVCNKNENFNVVTIIKISTKWEYGYTINSTYPSCEITTISNFPKKTTLE